MDDKLKKEIAAAIEFRVGRFHQNQALLNDVEELIDKHFKFEIAGYISLSSWRSIAWSPAVETILKREPFNKTPVFMLRS